MLNATVLKRIDVTKDLVIIQIKPDYELKEFLPGQYVALGLLGEAPRPADFPPETEVHEPSKIIKRAYSIGSSPMEKGHLEFYLAILPQGALTSRLALLREGDRIYMAPKITGTFTLQDVPVSHNLILVATGTGIAPFVSMIRTPSTWTSDRNITVIHGVRYPSDLAYREELIELQNERSNFSYFCTVSRPDSEWRGEKGYVQHLLEKKLSTLDPAVDHVFLCGNPAMIDDMEKLLVAREFTEHSKKKPGHLHLERYW